MLQMSPKPKINWPELYFMAEGSNEPFADVRIVTAKSEFTRIASERAFEFSSEPNTTDIIRAVDADQFHVYESVTIASDGDISVVINAADVSDDVMWRAMDMVADAMYELDGKPGTINFGEPLQFKPSDIPWLVLH